MPRDQLSAEEKESNIKQYGKAVPWEYVDAINVYTVSLENEHGVELNLRQLRTFVHEFTGEEQSFLGDDGASKFVFTSDWPSDNVIHHNGVAYDPFLDVTV